jgi:hypothetical protein
MDTQDKNKPKGSGSQNAGMKWAHQRGGKTIITDNQQDRPFEREPESRKPVCPNCGQWQDNIKSQPSTYLDCFNDCVERGFAPKGEREPETRMFETPYGKKSEAVLTEALNAYVILPEIKQQRDELLDSSKRQDAMLAKAYGERDELLAVFEAVKDMKHDIDLFYAKYRSPDNKYIAKLNAAIANAEKGAGQ